jgi:radical SAM enzyme (TIGR01210 family)
VLSTLRQPESPLSILALRPARTAQFDPFKPHGFFLEEERTASGDIAQTATILLTNKECPWRCLMCDLWKNTLTYTVPAGAIAKQIEFAVSQLESGPEQVKLYNSGSFFDAAAIPRADHPGIAEAVGFAGHVIVESHPRLVGEPALRFRDFLSGSLEVAMGLETVHPAVFPQLNKRFSLSDFSMVTEFLQKNEIAVRAFILVNPPFLDERDGIEWAVKSAEFAFNCGADVVSLIPTRTGNGAMDRLLESGDFVPPRFATLESAQEQALNLRRGRVFMDTWDLEQFSQCRSCLEKRRQRLHLTNLTQQVQPKIECELCGGQ